MSAVSGFVADIVLYYLHTAADLLVRAHKSQFDLTGEEIEALYWPPEEREAATIVTRRVLQGKNVDTFDAAKIGRMSVRAHNTYALVPSGFYSHIVDENTEAPAITLNAVKIVRWVTLIPEGPAGRCVNDAEWVDRCEVARVAADKNSAWASALAADLICYGEAKEAVTQVFENAVSLQDARNWLPQLPMMLNYSAGKYLYNNKFHAGFVSGGTRISEDTIAKAVGKIKDFKEVKNGWVPSPGQRARLKALQGWINKASFLMETTESAGDAEVMRKSPIMFGYASVEGAAVGVNTAELTSL